MFSSRTSWPLSPNRLSLEIEELKRKGVPPLDLTESNPTRCGFVFDQQRILAALANPQALFYTPDPRGLLSARQAVADYYAEQGIALDQAQIFLTTSTSEAYSYIFRLLADPGDAILVPQPSYPLFDFLAGLNDVRVIAYPLFYDRGWTIDLATLEKRLEARARAILVVHPNNPTGSYVKPQEQESLNRFCREHGVPVIADEVFLDYSHDHAAQQSFAANQNVLTFTLSGVSKISALPQMKVAWIATSGPAAEVEAALARLEVIADTYLSMNAPIQWAVPALLAQREDIQRQLLDRVLTNLAELDRQLAAQTTYQRLTVEGGWYAVLRVPVTQTDEELAVDLLRRKSVLVHPGHFYDFPSDGYLVLSLITPAPEFAEGIGRLMRLLIADF